MLSFAPAVLSECLAHPEARGYYVMRLQQHMRRRSYVAASTPDTTDRVEQPVFQFRKAFARAVPFVTGVER
jgi:hypothetical protein